MNNSATHCPARPFFLETGTLSRFCLYHAPNPGQECRGSFIYVHPFAEEMNKSRRMAALQSREYAREGFGVLQIDLYGCGDSSGDFSDARWEIWKADLAAAHRWLENNAVTPVSLWGVRLGALLALDFAKDYAIAPDNIVLWQPVVSGDSFLRQFLRMKMANDMLIGADEKVKGIQGIRDAITAGESVEVAGYELSPALAESIATMNAASLAPAATPVHWFEIVAESATRLPPPAARVATIWEQSGVDLRVHFVPGTSFWSSQEITECPALLSATTSLFREAPLEL